MSLREEVAIREALECYLHARAWLDQQSRTKRPPYAPTTADQVLASYGIRFPSPEWRRAEAEIVKRAREIRGDPKRRAYRNRTAKGVL